MQTKVTSSKAPKAIGPYSQAIKIPASQQLMFVSGNLPLDPASGEIVKGDIRLQTQQVLANLEAILTEAGSSFNQVVRVDIFLTNMGDFAAVNEEYAKKFQTATPPARQTVQVSGLPKGANIEISCIAMCDARV